MNTMHFLVLKLGINGVCNIGAVGDAKIDSSNTGGNTGAGMGLGTGAGPIGSSIGCGATGKGIIGKLPKGLVDIGSILCAIGSLDRFSNKRLFLITLFKNPITNLPSLLIVFKHLGEFFVAAIGQSFDGTVDSLLC